MLQYGLVLVHLHVNLEIHGRVLLGKWNDSTIECASEYELTFKFIRNQTQRSLTIAECDPMMRSCRMMETALGNKYNLSYTSRGGILHITHLDKDTSGIYTCCETYNTGYFASINISSHSMFLNDNSSTTSMGKVNGQTIECSSSAEITFKFISRKTNTSRTIAECDVMMRSCHMFGTDVNNKYTISYTGQGGMLRIDSLDEETEGTYICCETYNPSNVVSTYFYNTYNSTKSTYNVTDVVPAMDQTTTAKLSTGIPRQDSEANIRVIILPVCAALVIIVICVIILVKHFWDVKQKRKVKSLLETFDVVSLRLKLASTLYCSGYLTAAQYVMHDVRRLYNQYLIQAGRTRPVVIYEDCSKYACSTYADRSTSLTEGNVSLILRFYSYESYSVPPVLLYEMNNSVIESELGASGTCKQQCHNTVSVDEHAFMYYLQYLTSAEVHSNSSQKYSFVRV